MDNQYGRDVAERFFGKRIGRRSGIFAGVMEKKILFIPFVCKKDKRDFSVVFVRENVKSGGVCKKSVKSFRKKTEGLENGKKTVYNIIE